MNKIFTVSIIGVGARGGEAYGRYIHDSKDKFLITNLCDTNPERLVKYGEAFEVAEQNRFVSEEEFFKEKRSDVLLISTLDKLHVEMAEKALNLGYDILLEKPISDDLNELKSLSQTAKRTGRIVMVCHVLRYTVMIEKIKELLDSKVIGKLINIDHTENVGFWHQAHSYVRGNWRKSEETSPMIMAKCCHDLDLLQYFAESKCVSLSSYGNLSYFKKEYKPNGSSDRCVDCKYIESCPYSAKKIYIDMWKGEGSPENFWPYNVITDELPLTEEKLYNAIKTGPYGRCVFNCDNNVVDNQMVNMQFENGITANLKMVAFAKYGGRIIRFMGTQGEIYYDEAKRVIEVRKFFNEDEIIDVNTLNKNFLGHGGGDSRMIDRLYDVLSGNVDNVITSLDKSIESHIMALAAEKSRLNGGEKVTLADLIK